MAALPASIPMAASWASCEPVSSSVIANPAIATAGAALNSPAKRLGDSPWQISARATTRLPPARPLASRIATSCMPDGYPYRARLLQLVNTELRHQPLERDRRVRQLGGRSRDLLRGCRGLLGGGRHLLRRGRGLLGHGG